MIHNGSRSLCPYCALAMKALHAAGPKCAVHTGGAKARGLCVCTERAALVYRFGTLLIWADQLCSHVHFRRLKCRHAASKRHNNPLMHNKSVMQVQCSAHPSQNTLHKNTCKDAAITTQTGVLIIPMDLWWVYLCQSGVPLKERLLAVPPHLPEIMLHILASAGEQASICKEDTGFACELEQKPSPCNCTVWVDWCK